MNGEIEMWLDENHLLDKVNAISVISDPQRQGNISDEIFGFFFFYFCKFDQNLFKFSKIV